MDTSIEFMREKICELGRLMYDRHLTDSAGGNISARVGQHVCISPRYSGAKFRWNLVPRQILVTDMEGNKLDGEGEISRESKVHYRLYCEFPSGLGVVHAHPLNVLIFCAAGIPMQPVLEDTLKFGEIGFAPFAPAHSEELAQSVAAELHKKEDALEKQAAAVMAPWHGLFVLGRDIDAAFDAVERLDGNAYILMMGAMMTRPEVLKKRVQMLNDAAARFGK